MHQHSVAHSSDLSIDPSCVQQMHEQVSKMEEASSERILPAVKARNTSTGCGLPRCAGPDLRLDIAQKLVNAVPPYLQISVLTPRDSMLYTLPSLVIGTSQATKRVQADDAELCIRVVAHHPASIDVNRVAGGGSPATQLNQR